MVRKTARERLHQRDSRARSELLDGMFLPWIGGRKNKALVEQWGGVDPRDAKAVGEAIRKDILPVFDGMTLETQGRIRDAMAILAAGDGTEFREYWTDLNAPFGESEDDADAIFKALAPLLTVKRPPA